MLGILLDFNVLLTDNVLVRLHLLVLLFLLLVRRGHSVFEGGSVVGVNLMMVRVLLLPV